MTSDLPAFSIKIVAQGGVGNTRDGSDKRIRRTPDRAVERASGHVNFLSRRNEILSLLHDVCPCPVLLHLSDPLPAGRDPDPLFPYPDGSSDAIDFNGRFGLKAGRSFGRLIAGMAEREALSLLWEHFSCDP